MPERGSLLPQDRPMQIHVQFNPPSEFSIADFPLLKCHVIEPNMSETGETIASIPLKISARSVFAKFQIHPTEDINFGVVHLGQSKRHFTIENIGEFDFKFNLSKLIRPSSPGKTTRKMGRRGTIVADSRNGSAGSRRPGLTREATQTLKLSLGR